MVVPAALPGTTSARTQWRLQDESNSVPSGSLLSRVPPLTLFRSARLANEQGRTHKGAHFGSSREGASGSARTMVNLDSFPGGALNETVGSSCVWSMAYVEPTTTLPKEG